MRTLVMAGFVTLDGVMQAPGGPEEDTDGGFPYGGWQFPFADEELGEIVDGYFRSSSALLLGRRTYDIFAGYWPAQAEAGDEFAAALGRMPKYVASRTLTDPGWENTTVLPGDARDAVAALKEGAGGDILIQGSTRLLQDIHHLVDEYRLFTYPVVLGRGKRLFAEGSPARTLRAVETRATTGGAVYTAWVPAGEVRTGSF